jgi:hypothetical protein
VDDFRRVALHELGHAVGLDHSVDAGDVMNALQSNIYLPQFGDTNTLQGLYGSTTHTLTLINNGSGSIVVEPEVPATGVVINNTWYNSNYSSLLDCRDPTCQLQIQDGLRLSLHSVAEAGGSFLGWEGISIQSAAVSLAPLTGDRSLTANFSLLNSATPEVSELGSDTYCVDKLCGAGEGDCDGLNQCQAGLVCMPDAGPKYGFRSNVDVCEAPVTSSLGSNSYCVDNLCGVGEGDCDGDTQCQDGLVCTADTGPKYGFRSIVDVCEEPVAGEIGSNTYCDDKLCGVGQGDCDGDNQCQSGLVCATDTGSNYGFRFIVDVCEEPPPAELGSDTYCVENSCGVGEGDCDHDNECQAGLVCVNNVGANYGFRPIVDICEQPDPVELLGSDAYCEDNLCGVGEGDCEASNQCQDGLVCVTDVGSDYGFRSIVDVCEEPSPAELGSDTYCAENSCGAGEGDCDRDSECQAGLRCVDNVGANYGFRSIVDVCEAPAQPTSGWVENVFDPASNFESLCASPRMGIDPYSGLLFDDQPGTVLDENFWLRSWSNDLYLWYDEIVDQDPGLFATADYFQVLKSFATTASGNPKDKFHFTWDTASYQALAQSGVSAAPPRHIVVAYTDPDTPATTAPANLTRGAVLLRIDGVSVEDGNDVSTLNAGLFPSSLNESHEFTVLDLGSSTPRTFTMSSDTITSVPVQNVSTISTPTGLVGYMLFNDHIATSEQQLITAINQLQLANITDLVLDLRYNGGGYLVIASQLAYMIAGLGPTAGQVFEETQFNDKHTIFNPVTGALLLPEPFQDTAVGLSATAGLNLPSLNLDRVFVLTGPDTCSASESIINGLRGVDVEVIQIGSTTCGKPYAFYPQDNCGTTYFSIQIRGVNAKGFGDYTDGFSPFNTTPAAGSTVPGCSVADDFTHLLGDPEESRLAAALAYRENQSCPTPSGLAARSLNQSGVDLSAVNGTVYKSPWLKNRILLRP